LASVAPTLSPDGFTPRPNSDEDDYAFLAGVRGERLLDAWHWDLSSGYGADRPDIGMTQSVNAAIYRETGNSPRSFDLAHYRNSQWTSNLELGRRGNPVGIPAPGPGCWSIGCCGSVQGRSFAGCWLFHGR
ncbi:hypothetical protein ACV34S_34665, partial [Pseudomonas aeruginosa]